MQRGRRCTAFSASIASGRRRWPTTGSYRNPQILQCTKLHLAGAKEFWASATSGPVSPEIAAWNASSSHIRPSCRRPPPPRFPRRSPGGCRSHPMHDIWLRSTRAAATRCWIDCFLDGIATIADEAVASARELFNLVSADRARLLRTESASVSALRLFEQLPRHPIVTVASTIKMIDASKPTATRAIEVLAEAGILVETTTLHDSG
jgi:hypothetical protein